VRLSLSKGGANISTALEINNRKTEMKTEMKTDPVTFIKKEYRTLHALANLLVMPMYALKDLPPLGEVGQMDIFFDDVDYRLYFRRLPSGRIGKWKLNVVDYCEIENPDSEPDYYTGYGQHSKWETIDLDQYQTIEL